MKKKRSLAEALAVQPGITAVIGGGGKTSLLGALGIELRKAGKTVVLCTTTKIRPFLGLAGGELVSISEVHRLLREAGLIWAGTPAGQGKWSAPHIPLSELSNAADYVLVEADGSAGRPMKAHRSFEPVIPDGTDQTILVVGASGFGQRIRDAAHCPKLYAERAGRTVNDAITPVAAARVIAAEQLHDRIFVNQTDTEAQLTAARVFAQIANRPGCAGALQSAGEKENICLLW